LIPSRRKKKSRRRKPGVDSPPRLPRIAEYRISVVQ
jgi:hypothetical protein